VTALYLVVSVVTAMPKVVTTTAIVVAAMPMAVSTAEHQLQ